MTSIVGVRKDEESLVVCRLTVATKLALDELHIEHRPVRLVRRGVRQVRDGHAVLLADGEIVVGREVPALRRRVVALLQLELVAGVQRAVLVACVDTERDVDGEGGRVLQLELREATPGGDVEELQLNELVVVPEVVSKLDQRSNPRVAGLHSQGEVTTAVWSDTTTIARGRVLVLLSTGDRGKNTRLCRRRCRRGSSRSSIPLFKRRSESEGEEEGSNRKELHDASDGRRRMGRHTCPNVRLLSMYPWTIRKFISPSLRLLEHEACALREVPRK